MPNLSGIADVAEALGGKSVLVVEKRCVAVRNRHSSCRKCIEACVADAISVGDNSVKIDAEACVSCGACTVVCPTEALVPVEPADVELASAAAEATRALGGNLSVFACARMAARREGDPDKYVSVPCLARMEESLLLQLASHGVGDVVLVDGTCSTCKFGGTSEGVTATVESANSLLAAQGSSVRVRRASEFPPEAIETSGRKSFAAARRGFFSQAGGMAKDAVKVATEKALDETLGKQNEKKELNLRELLRPDKDGGLPQFEPSRRMNTLDAMDAIGQSVVPEIETRLFGNVSIDESKCRACGMCTVFCPTGALKKSEEKPASGEGSYLEFQLMECVQCNLCADTCLQKCITVSDVIATSELFDFEPRLIHLPDPPARGSLLSRLKSTGR